MFSYVYSRFPMITTVCSCMFTYATNIYLCLPILHLFTFGNPYLLVFSYVYDCLLLLPLITITRVYTYV